MMMTMESIEPRCGNIGMALGHFFNLVGDAASDWWAMPTLRWVGDPTLRLVGDGHPTMGPHAQAMAEPSTGRRVGIAHL